MRKLYIDFETYSEADIRKIGTWAYSRHPSTEVLIMAWAFDNDTPSIWLPWRDTEAPNWLQDASMYGDIDFQINAWNSFFELCIIKNVLGFSGLDDPKHWNDTAAEAAALALPRGLEECGLALGLKDDQAKSKDGKKLIQLFSKPKKSLKKANRGMLIRAWPLEYPEQFEQFCDYCVQDVVAEREIAKVIRPLQLRTRELWELDQKINLRGVQFDVKNVENATIIAGKAKKNILEEVSEITGGDLANIQGRGQFLTFIEDKFGITLENAQKEYLKRTLEELKEKQADPTLCRLIEARLMIAKSSLAKFDKLVSIIDGDRAHGLLRFHGASTGRWSGNLFQPQNLPRKSLYCTNLCIDFLKKRDPELIELFFGDCREALTMCLRGMITAKENHRLIVSDFSQIESRVLAWLAGDTEKLEAYRQGLDIYKLNAAAAFKTPYELVTKEERQIGKVIELACGYQGAVGAFQAMAPTYGVVIPDEDAKVLINAWRVKNPKIVSFWHNVEAAAVKAVAEPGSVQTVRGVSFMVIGSGYASFLFCKLPSGRAIAYHRPHLKEGAFDKVQVGFFGVNSVTKTYGRQTTYGGKLVENITQGTAMCCMGEKMLQVEKAGYPIVLTVHDEIVAEVNKDFGSLEEFNKIMCEVPAWAQGLPIEADGYEAERYRK